MQALGEYLRQHKVGDALNAARAMPKSPVAKVMESGLSALLQGREAPSRRGVPEDVKHFDLVDSVNRALERVKERETSNLLRKGPHAYLDIASATPFIGLLGTVVGILGTSAPQGWLGRDRRDRPKISKRWCRPALGLAVAIIAAMSFNFFTSRVEMFVIDMNDVSSEFIDYVLREGRA